jgi:hypothetical protein
LITLNHGNGRGSATPAFNEIVAGEGQQPSRSNIAFPIREEDQYCAVVVRGVGNTTKEILLKSQVKLDLNHTLPLNKTRCIPKEIEFTTNFHMK